MTLHASPSRWNTRRFTRLGAAAVLLSTGVFPLAHAQTVRAPRYTGNTASPVVDAPVQQLNLPPLPPAITPHGTVVEDVVARINDQIISRSDVERSEQQLQQDDSQPNVTQTERIQRQKDMLRDMIDQQLLLSKAKELGINADTELVKQLDAIRQQNNLASLEDLEKAAREQGVNYEDFKAKIRNQILTQDVVRDEVGRRLQMTQGEEAKFYEEHKSEFVQPEQIRLNEILIPLPENATAEQIRQAEDKANSIKSQVVQGVPFADLAKKYSGGPTAAQGGELGLYKRGALAKVLEDQTFDLKPGESTQPIRTRQGFVILKVTDHQAAGPAPLKSVEPQVQEAMYIQQMQPALRAYLTKLREQSYVDIQPGFVDSGASGNQTKPILFTAYAPPPVKIKAEKDKTRYDRSGRYAPAAKPVISSPDTNGGRTLTGADAATSVTPAATPAGLKTDPGTGLAVLPSSRTSSGKRVKVKREKLRFGQAPRIALASDASDVATPQQTGTVTPGASSPLAGTGAIMASGGSLGGVNESANLSDNPLTPKAGPRTKTRFSEHAEEHKEKKLEKTTLKKEEKLASKPEAMTTEEKETAQAQAAPLGLGGNTVKKPAKPARVKGAPKQRLEDKSTAKPVPTPVDQTASPALAPSADLGGGEPTKKEAPKADTTTLPPVTTPTQGQPQQGPTTPQQQLPGSAPPR